MLVGTVLSAQCKPVPNALLDFWHSDEEGAYDNRGFRYRGHQHADAQGRYRLETIVPAQYPGRTRHIHVKVQAPGKRILTTQIYFPGDPGNARDFLYRPELEMKKAGGGPGATARRPSTSSSRPDCAWASAGRRTRRSSSRGCAGCARRGARSSA